MDKSWTKFPLYSDEYREGVTKFISSSKKYARNPDRMSCPCKVCRNLSSHDDDDLFIHLCKYGFDPHYTVWVAHGEEPSKSLQIEDDGKETMLDEVIYMQEVHQMFKDAHHPFHNGDRNSVTVNLEEEIRKKVEEAEVPLYPGCTKHTKLSATLNFYKLKAEYGVPNNAFDAFMKEIKDTLPDTNTFPESTYTVKKILKEFDLGYEKIHACINDCCLFRKENKDMDRCPKCDSSRWKVNKRTKKISVGVPAKVLRYFPVIPRVQRMFLKPEMRDQLTWHSTHHSQDGMMRHPVDSVTWSTVDKKWPSFASDPRNLRFGLATDGFNPFSNLSSTHSTWPVILVIYNLPPDVCMSSENLMMSLLIPGPKQPGNDIDIYLEPLIDDLKELWNNGVEMYDAYDKAMFNLKAILLWTINDFPAYGNLSGLCTHGEFACPVCGPEISSQYLGLASKTIYMEHRRWLPPNDKLRSEYKRFNGKVENKKRPKLFTGSLHVRAVRGFKNDWGKKKGHIKRFKKGDPAKQLKKKSIFFDLPYWEVFLVRHNLDMMHIEKNFSENLLKFLFDENGKSTIGLESRRDVELIELMDDVPFQERKEKLELPSERYTFTKDEKQVFCKRLYVQRFPHGYCSNIGNCVRLDKSKIIGLKSHDHHVLMQHMLSVALRGLLPEGLIKAIFRMSSHFKELCQRVLDKNRLEVLEDEIVITLCMLEMYLPPSFFDIMVHLTIHIGREAKLCGPVQYRWMYPFERYMKVLKDYTKNPANPEGSIAENYLANECVRFCGRYMKQVAAISKKRKRNEEVEDETIVEGSTLLKGKVFVLSDAIQKELHLFVLLNSEEVVPFIEVHKEELKLSDRRLLKDSNLLEKKHLETFTGWLQNKIKSEDANVISESLKMLVKGPRHSAMSHNGFVINGRCFHTIEANVSTQDYGVYTEADTLCRSSAKDKSQKVAKLKYYGIIKDILVLDFNKFRLAVFRCDWANIVSGVKSEDGFTLVNLHEGLSKKDPFILASHVQQVFYSRESDISNWYTVIKAPPRGFHDLALFDESVFASSTI